MFGFGKRNKVETAIKHITIAGRHTAEWFQDEETLQWQHADRWSAICGTIPAFAFVIMHEMSKSKFPASPSTQKEFFKSIEDILFKMYEEDRLSYTVPVKQCLALLPERRKVCEAVNCSEDTIVPMDTVLSVIFPDRLCLYQTDWAAGFLSSRALGLSEYAAMRLAADLTGVATPQNLVGRTANDLGIMPFGTASFVLTEFVAAYLQECG
jgi:hypothetical protein